ncbi:MAG TPA: coproporphyrinogen-III oxidase family protein [Candidatus Limnocylindria bacterium]
MNPARAPYALRLPNPGKHLYPPPLTDIEPSVASALLAEAPQGGVRAQLYIHLPFCATICTFCPIYKFELRSAGAVDTYLSALTTELRDLSQRALIRALRVENVYFGGGTPSVVPDHHLAALVALIRRSFDVSPAAQWTFEGHVGSLTKDKLRFVRSLGFDRVSTGVQTFDPTLRAALNLTPTEADIRRCVDDARAVGLTHFNLDLMYSLPGQDERAWEQDLRTTGDINPQGVDVYETVVAHGTQLYGEVAQGARRVEPDPRRRAAQYTLAEEVLASHGYRQRNLFVWDQPGYENRLLGRQSELRDQHLHIVGAGLSSYSLLNGRPFINAIGRKRYFDQVARVGHGIAAYHDPTPRQRMERFMVMSLEDFTIDARRFTASFGQDVEDAFGAQLDSFADRGLLTASGDGYDLTPRGRAWASTMAAEFFDAPVIAEILRTRLAGRPFYPLTHEEAIEFPLFALFHPQLIFPARSDLRLFARYLWYLFRHERDWLRRLVASARVALLVYGPPDLGRVLPGTRTMRRARRDADAPESARAVRLS